MYIPILGKKSTHKGKIMASGGLPISPTFSEHADPNTTNIRWKKWMDKLQNLFVALDIDNDKKWKATLLHYAGDEVFDIYHCFTDQQKGIGATTSTEDGSSIPNEHETTKKSLTDYFTSQKNTSYEIFKFQRALQNPDENLNAYHARLRTLASTFDFENTDREILAQILLGCLSSKLRRKALREISSLKKVLLISISVAALVRTRALPVRVSDTQWCTHTESVFTCSTLHCHWRDNLMPFNTASRLARLICWASFSGRS